MESLPRTVLSCLFWGNFKLCANYLIPWNRVLLEKPPVTQPLETFSEFHIARRFIMFTAAAIILCPETDESSPYLSAYFLRSNDVWVFRVHLYFLFYHNMHFFSPLTSVTCYAHQILLDLIILIIIEKE
jgi:hypothetical protein